MKLFLSPHQDDEMLFGAYTLIRKKPFVVICTSSVVQWERGDGITDAERSRETVNALRTIGITQSGFIGLPDSTATAHQLEDGLRALLGGQKIERVWAPPIEGGHKQHDMVGYVATEIWKNKVIYYSTYTKERLYPLGEIEVKPTAEEIDLKDKALDCYTSQLRINRAHFDAVRGRSEYLNLHPIPMI